ncbi:restriction endonuclease [Streptomyces sp. DG2A-72]|uniref:McrC family protein n=1 Tax=Streptomyces sp. DG2A-72 TaxID=3051386 RepID=UPI00265B9F47|nr:restriction endonuclease [Streptomyces sp. DG2A-72]MDO0932015.1 restriction endonuclease [Streptomyces sp. DG2A-72]
MTTPPALARIDLDEGAGWSTWTLTPGQAHVLTGERASKLVDIKPAGRQKKGTRDRYELRAKAMVGGVRLGGDDSAVQLRIAPKIPVDRLLYLLAYASGHAKWSDEPVEAGARHELLPAVGYAFTEAADRALRPGVLLGYREVDDTLPMLRGRLRAPAQLRRRPGLSLPLEVTYDDHTPDIGENRLLLGAARRLIRLPGLDPTLRARLRRIVAQLDGVTAPRPGAPLPAWTATRLNSRYQRALGLAELILRGASYELDDGRRVLVDGLLLEMWRVFETFLATALGEELQRRAGGRAEPRDRDHHLDLGKKELLKPDLIHYLPPPDGGRRLVPAIIVDAKYKDGTKRPDLYQMFAYCVRLGTSEGHLVSAAGNENVMEVPVAGQVIRLYCHVVDLSLPYRELRARIGELAGVLLRIRTESAAPTP